MPVDNDKIFEKLPPEVYSHLVDCYLHQNELGWSRAEILLAIEAGSIAAAFSVKPLAIYALIFGMIFVVLLWILVERDWVVRDQNLPLIRTVHKPLGVVMGKPANGKATLGTRILRAVFGLLLLVDLALIALFALAKSCDCKVLDAFRTTATAT